MRSPRRAIRRPTVDDLMSMTAVGVDRPLHRRAWRAPAIARIRSIPGRVQGARYHAAMDRRLRPHRLRQPARATTSCSCARSISAPTSSPASSASVTAGCRSTTLVQLKALDITPEFARSAVGQGRPLPSVDELVQIRCSARGAKRAFAPSPLGERSGALPSNRWSIGRTRDGAVAAAAVAADPGATPGDHDDQACCISRRRAVAAIACDTRACGPAGRRAGSRAAAAPMAGRRSIRRLSSRSTRRAPRSTSPSACPASRSTSARPRPIRARSTCAALPAPRAMS